MNGDGKFYKKKPTDTVMWMTNTNVGEFVFSIDGKKTYNLFRDYPHNMTEAEVRIFDNDNPEWASFFSNRKRGR